MTICFKGNSCKYEIEAVMKLFLPVMTFDFLFEEENTEGDFCIVSADGNSLEVKVCLDGKNAARSCLLRDGEEAELNLCRMLYECMRELTGIRPQWGYLTGIRPVKKVNAMLDEGQRKIRRVRQKAGACFPDGGYSENLF